MECLYLKRSVWSACCGRYMCKHSVILIVPGVCVNVVYGGKDRMMCRFWCWQIGLVPGSLGGHSQPLPQQEDDLPPHRDEEIDPSDVAQ